MAVSSWDTGAVAEAGEAEAGRREVGRAQGRSCNWRASATSRMVGEML